MNIDRITAADEAAAQIQLLSKWAQMADFLRPEEHDMTMLLNWAYMTAEEEPVVTECLDAIAIKWGLHPNA